MHFDKNMSIILEQTKILLAKQPALLHIQHKKIETFERGVVNSDGFWRYLDTPAVAVFRTRT